MKRTTILVTPHVELALRLAKHLDQQGVDAKVVTRHAVQVLPSQAEKARRVGEEFIRDQGKPNSNEQ